MSLEETFPEDPYTPSLRYAASSLIPFNLPWGPGPIKIGTGFHSKLAKSGNPFSSHCAFDNDSLRETKLKYRNELGGTFTQAESSFGMNSQEHMTFSLGASASIANVSASGQAKFENSAIKNTDAIKSSMQGQIFTGYVCYDEMPSFSWAAKNAVRASRNDAQGQDQFEAKYGDYYIAGLRIGAGNGNELSASSTTSYEAEAKSYSITVSVKIFRWKVNKTYSDSTSSSKSFAMGTIQFNGYDTLAKDQVADSGNTITKHDQLLGRANTNLENGKLMQGRLEQSLKRFELVDGCPVTQEQADTLCSAGLVLEIQLLPFAKLRDYISSRSRF